ncbi:MAG: hypothetical protein ABI665_20930 [Vicinamibacterales bacterium]
MLSSRKLSLALAFSLASAAAYAQTSPAPQPARAPATVQVDSRFAAWLGCWRLEDDLMGSNVRVCVVPEQLTGVKLQTLVGAQKGSTELLLPDKVSRPITDTECKGTEKSEWSQDGLRVFRFADVGCGKESARKLSSVSFLMRGPTFVQVQYVETDQNKSVRVQRYRRAVDQSLADGTRAPQPSATLAMTAPSADVRWDIDDVIEASAKLPGDAVQAALTEVNGPFDLNKKTLIAMSNAHVDERVIDLMVALTYPQKLVVNRAGSAYSGVTGISMGGGLYDPFMSPIIPGSAFSDCYSPYGYRTAYASCGPAYGLYGYNPYGYGYGNYGGYYGGYYPGYPGNGWVVVDPSPGQPAPAQPEGRAIKGFGYTQIQPREPDPTPRFGNSGSNGSGTAGSNSNGGGNTNNGSSGASSGGYSGGSSSGDSGRVAVPRPPGGQ